MVVLSLGKLKRVPVGGRDQRAPAGSLLAGGCRRKEVVGFVSRRLGAGESPGADELGQQLELLEQLGVELAARLVRPELDVAIRRSRERVPGDHDRPRTLRLPEPEQHAGEPDQCVRGAAVRPTERLRKRVVRAMGEGVAVDGKERRSH